MNPLWTMSIYEKTKNSPIFKGLARPLNCYENNSRFDFYPSYDGFNARPVNQMVGTGLILEILSLGRSGKDHTLCKGKID